MLATLLLVLPFCQDPAPVARAWQEYPEADALEYSFELRIDPRKPHLQGSVRYRFRAVEDLRAVRLDSVAGPDYRIRFFQSGELRAERSGDLLVVQLENPVPAGEEFEFRAELEGAPPDGFYFRDTRYGEPCAFTDHFSVRARGWFPCEDHPGDRARFSLQILAPEGFDVVCSGDVMQVSEDADDGVGVSHWPEAGWLAFEAAMATEMPTYMLGIAVAPYARVEEAGDERLVPHYVYSRDAARAKRGCVHHAAWMQLMEETFGPYDYSKYCVVQVPTRWGGMENAGNTWVMESLFDPPRFGIGTLAHEFAHQWFGDGVGYRDWQEVWLSEGFASYFGPWLDAATEGPPLARSMDQSRRRWLNAREGETLPIRWDGYGTPDESLNSNTYPKGAWVLHMLRGELGDAAFFEGLRSWYQANRGRAVDTVSLRKAMELRSGRDLRGFFAQWLDRPGCPELRLAWGADSVVVEQVQAGEPFDFLLPLQWTGADGRVRKQSFRVRERRLEIRLAGGPVKVPVVDPDVELLYRKAR